MDRRRPRPVGRVSCTTIAVRRWAVLLLVIVLVTGCGASGRREPGLFGRPDPGTSATTAPPSTRASADAVLPVVSDATWTSSDGLRVTVRMAVHAIRRMPGATVLDWSITPLSAAGLNDGDPVPASVLLGLDRFGDGDTTMMLVDAGRHRAYRPFRALDDHHCLCTPIWAAQRTLEIGRTRLLQLTFPPLPADLTAVDVVAATAPPFPQVPVTPAGEVPRPTGDADLARPVGIHPELASTQAFSYAGLSQSQQYIAFADDVVVTGGFTTLRWTVQVVTDGDGLQGLPPIAARPVADQTPYEPDSASGPALRLPGTTATIGTQLVTTDLDGRGTLECLCSNLRAGYAASREQNQRVTLITTFPALPSGTERVDVVFPGLRPLTGLPVTTVADRGKPVGAPVDAGLPAPSWTYDPTNPPTGWDVGDWPTPLPDRSQLASFESAVDRLR